MVGPLPLAPLYQKTDYWFQRAAAALLGEVPCQLGCTRCCIGPFPITVLDTCTLQDGLATLPSEDRQRITERAHQQITAMEAAFPQLTCTDRLDQWSDQEIDQFVRAFHELPCPALEVTGHCSVYQHRPLVCRSMGIPTKSQNGITYGACEIQTFIPIVQLSSTLRQDATRLIHEEAAALELLTNASDALGEEVFLPYGFLPKRPRGESYKTP